MLPSSMFQHSAAACFCSTCCRYSYRKLTAGEKWWRWKKVAVWEKRDSPVLMSVVRPVAGVLTAPRCVMHRSEGQRPARRLGSPLSTHQYFTSDTFTCWLAPFRTRDLILHTCLATHPSWTKGGRQNVSYRSSRSLERKKKLHVCPCPPPINLCFSSTAPW